MQPSHNLIKRILTKLSGGPYSGNLHWQGRFSVLTFFVDHIFLPKYKTLFSSQKGVLNTPPLPTHTPWVRASSHLMYWKISFAWPMFWLFLHQNQWFNIFYFHYICILTIWSTISAPTTISFPVCLGFLIDNKSSSLTWKNKTNW